MKVETERLLLRDFVAEDWQRVLEYQSDPLYLRYSEWTERTPLSVQDFVGWFLGHQKENPRIKFQLAIILKSNNQLIGNCGFRMNRTNDFQADIGYELDSNYWHNGYMNEAAHAMLDFGFSSFDVHRVWAWCVADNISSAHVLEKLGMRQEGHLRENEYYRSRWWDTLIYAILADEWKIHRQTHHVEWKQME